MYLNVCMGCACTNILLFPGLNKYGKPKFSPKSFTTIDGVRVIIRAPPNIQAFSGDDLTAEHVLGSAS